MATLVETQKAKWTYMFDKIDKELRKWTRARGVRPLASPRIVDGSHAL